MTPFFSYLTNAQTLESLEFSVAVLELIGCAQPLLQFVTQLRELTLDLEDVPGTLGLLDSQRNVTNLTCLNMCFLGWHPPSVKPFVELTSIRTLTTTYALLTDARGTIFSPVAKSDCVGSGYAFGCCTTRSPVFTST